MNSGIGGGALGQGSMTARAQAQNPSNGAGAPQPGNGDAETSEFMQIVAQMVLQQAAMTGGSIISNMQPDDAGDE